MSFESSLESITNVQPIVEETTTSAFDDSLRSVQRGPTTAGRSVSTQPDVGLLSGIGRGLARGAAQTGAAFNLLGPTDTEDVADIARYTQRMRSPELAASREYQRFTSASTFGEAWDRFWDAPIQITAELIAESFIPSLGAIGGAAIGTLAGPGIGTIAGAAIGAGIAGASSGYMEYASQYLDTLAESGVDLTDPASISAAFDDEELISRAREMGLKKGIPVGIFDAASVGLAGRIAAPAKKALEIARRASAAPSMIARATAESGANGLLRAGFGGAARLPANIGEQVGRRTAAAIGASAAEVGAQSLYGAGGETAGQLATGQPLQPGAIMAEAIGELGPGVFEAAAGTVREGQTNASRLREDAGQVSPRGNEPVVGTSKGRTNLEQQAPIQPGGTTQEAPTGEVAGPTEQFATPEQKKNAEVIDLLADLHNNPLRSMPPGQIPQRSWVNSFVLTLRKVNRLLGNDKAVSKQINKIEEATGGFDPSMELALQELHQLSLRFLPGVASTLESIAEDAGISIDDVWVRAAELGQEGLVAIQQRNSQAAEPPVSLSQEGTQGEVAPANPIKDLWANWRGTGTAEDRMAMVEWADSAGLIAAEDRAAMMAWATKGAEATPPAATPTEPPNLLDTSSWITRYQAEFDQLVYPEPPIAAEGEVGTRGELPLRTPEAAKTVQLMRDAWRDMTPDQRAEIQTFSERTFGRPVPFVAESMPELTTAKRNEIDAINNRRAGYATNITNAEAPIFSVPPDGSGVVARVGRYPNDDNLAPNEFWNKAAAEQHLQSARAELKRTRSSRRATKKRQESASRFAAANPVNILQIAKDDILAATTTEQIESIADDLTVNQFDYGLDDATIQELRRTAANRMTSLEGAQAGPRMLAEAGDSPTALIKLARKLGVDTRGLTNMPKERRVSLLKNRLQSHFDQGKWWTAYPTLERALMNMGWERTDLRNLDLDMAVDLYADHTGIHEIPTPAVKRREHKTMFQRLVDYLRKTPYNWSSKLSPSLTFDMVYQAIENMAYTDQTRIASAEAPRGKLSAGLRGKAEAVVPVSMHQTETVQRRLLDEGIRPWYDAVKPTGMTYEDMGNYLHARTIKERYSGRDVPLTGNMTEQESDQILAKWDNATNRQYSDNLAQLWNTFVKSESERVPSIAKFLSIVTDGFERKYFPNVLEAFADDAIPDNIREQLAETKLRKLEGGGQGRSTLNPIEMLLARVQTIVTIADRQALAQQILDDMNTNRDAFLLVADKLGLDLTNDKTTLDAMTEAVKAQMGIDGKIIPTDKLREYVKFFSPYELRGDSSRITVYGSEGQSTTITIPSDVKEMLDTLGPRKMSVLFNLAFTIPTRTFRLGTTALSLAFGGRNMMKDVVTGRINTYSKPDIGQWWTAWSRMLVTAAGEAKGVWKGTEPTNPLFKFMQQVGIGHSTFVKQDETIGLLNHLDLMAAGDEESSTKKAYRSSRSAIDKLENTIALSELVTRATEGGLALQELLRNGELRVGNIDETNAASATWEGTRFVDKRNGQQLASMEAVLSALTPDQTTEVAAKMRRVSSDFGDRGYQSEVASKIIPYSSSAIAGIKQVIRTGRRDPKRAMILGLSYVTIPTLMLWWKNKDEDWYKDQPAVTKYSNWQAKVGDTIVRIPKPFDVGDFFGTVPEAMLDALYQKNPQEIKGGIGVALDRLSPIDLSPGGALASLTGVVGKIGIEQIANKRFFGDRPIVPEGEKNLPPAEQYGPYTAGMAVGIGQAINVSPRRIEHIMRSFFGRAYFEYASSISMLANWHDGVAASDIPVVGTFVQRGGTGGVQSESVDKVYGDLSALETIQRSETGELTAEQKTYLRNLRAAKSNLRLLRDRMTSATTDTERSQLGNRMRMIAMETTANAPDVGVAEAATPIKRLAQQYRSLTTNVRTVIFNRERARLRSRMPNASEARIDQIAKRRMPRELNGLAAQARVAEARGNIASMERVIARLSQLAEGL